MILPTLVTLSRWDVFELSLVRIVLTCMNFFGVGKEHV